MFALRRPWACGLSRLIVYGSKLAVGVLASFGNYNYNYNYNHNNCNAAAWAYQFIHMYTIKYTSRSRNYTVSVSSLAVVLITFKLLIIANFVADNRSSFPDASH